MSTSITAIPGSETVRADKIDYALALHESIRHALDYGDDGGQDHSFFVTYTPGNGTKYEMIITPLGNLPTRDEEGIAFPAHDRFSSEQLLISLVNFRTCAVLTSHSSPEYISEKLKIGLPDAAAISFLLKGSI